MKRFILSLFIAALVTIGYGQKGNAIEDLNFYADVIANAGNPIHKQRAHDAFSEIMDEWINSSKYNENDLESIQWLSVKSPEDESFKLITWQLNKDMNDNSYYGYIVKNNKVHKLKSASNLDDLEYDVLSTDDWAGVMYYNILTVEKEGKKIYVLFGYDAHENYENRKIADVLTFENDEPVFGLEIFKKQDPGERGVIKNRLVLDYASDSNVSLNYNPGLGMIVYDNLIPRMGRVAGQGPTMLPDGSYVGYKWDGTHFNYVDKLYHETLDSAPFPKPVIGKGDKRDVMGQNAKKKTKKRKKG